MKFREWFNSNGVQILAGKNAINNEALIAQADKEEIVLHTEESGSPFVNIKIKKPTKKDIYDAALFCAKYSQDWRDHKSDVVVHIFKKKDIYKKKEMKTGTFGVKKFKIIIAKKEDIKKI